MPQKKLFIDRSIMELSGTDWSRFGMNYMGWYQGAHNIRVIEASMVSLEDALKNQEIRDIWEKAGDSRFHGCIFH